MHSCSDVPTPETPVGAGGKRSIPDGSEDTCVRADTPAAGGVAEGRRGGRRCPVRAVQAGRAEDRRGSPGGGGERRPGPGLLRERGGARARVPEWLPAGPAADGGRRHRVRGAAGRGSRRAVRVADPGGAGRADRRARAAGRRAVRPRLEHAGHRGGLPGRRRPEPLEPDGREPGHRAALAGVRGVRDPRSERVRRGLPVRRRGGGAAARRDAARSGAVRLGDHRGGPQGAAAPGARARRRTRRAVRPSSRTSNAAGCPTPCSSSPTGRPA